jgi:hypothetical protein
VAPCDFWLFPKIKINLKDRHWGSVEAVERVTTAALNSLQPADFAACFLQWERRWAKCLQLGGDYFEGDNIPDDD